MTVSRLALCAFMVLSAAAAQAADPPADCSKGAVPDQPLKVVFNGKPVTASHVVVKLNSQTMTVNDKTFVGNRLIFADNASFFDRTFEIDFTLALPQGESLAGRTYLLYPSKSGADQPKLSGTTGLPEIQGWGLESEEIGANIGNAFNVASMRLVFGTMANSTLAGQIRFCLAKDSVDRFTEAKVDTTHAIGRFEAVVE